MTTNKSEQPNIFSLFGIPDEFEEKKRQAEEERKKRLEESKMAASLKESAPSSSKSTPKKEEPFEVNLDTFIYHLGERIAITSYFTPEEIENGLLRKKKDEESVERIKGEDVRKRLEKVFPDLIAAYTDMVYIKQKNMIMAVPKAKKKGLNQESNKSSAPAEGFSISSKIPFSILRDFVGLSKEIFLKFGTEFHGDIYFNLENKMYFLDIPQQIAYRETVERTEDSMVTALKLIGIPFVKVMEIHSHHEWAPFPSSLDDQSERQGNMLYSIVGRVDQFFPQITTRYFNTDKQEHVSVDPSIIFDNPFDTVIGYDTSVVEVPTHE